MSSPGAPRGLSLIPATACRGKVVSFYAHYLRSVIEVEIWKFGSGCYFLWSASTHMLRTRIQPSISGKLRGSYECRTLLATPFSSESRVLAPSVYRRECLRRESVKITVKFQETGREFFAVNSLSETLPTVQSFCSRTWDVRKGGERAIMDNKRLQKASLRFATWAGRFA